MDFKDRIKNRKLYKASITVTILILFSFCFIVYGFDYDGYKWNDSDIPVGYYINSSGAPFGFSSAIQSACNTWNDVSCSYFKFVFLGSTYRTNAEDGHILWQWNKTGSGIGSDDVAITSTTVNTFTKRIIKCEAEFNGTLTWSVYGYPSFNEYDVENAAVHEAGHMLHLDDLYGIFDSEKTMYGVTEEGETKKRTLHQDDINGICYIYTDISSCSLTITSPDKNHTWIRGKEYYITWDTVGNCCGVYVKITLFKGGSLYKIIAENTSNDGIYYWSIPFGLPESTNYRIKISSTSDPLSCYDYSDYFSISCEEKHIYYQDADSDNYGDINSTIQACSAPEGYVDDNTDCNDNDMTVNPGAPEICDGKDNDCDKIIPSGEADADKDGFRKCQGDCDDTDHTFYPGALELCDGKDNDCDGIVLANEADEDQDFFKICEGDCDDTDPNIYPGAPELCDGKDNDCDSVVPANEADEDQDFFKICEGDCDDTDPNIYPGAPELCDGKDNDCKGEIDEGLATQIFYKDEDSDGFGNSALSLYDCRRLPGYVSNNEDCDDNNQDINPSSEEICDCIDNNCNEQADEDCRNIEPTAPSLNYPPNYEHHYGDTNSLLPLLSVNNSTDHACQILTYDFEVYSDQGLTLLVTSVSEINEEENTTAWQVDITLEDNTFYYWRSRSYDGIDNSEWMDTAKFFVNTSNDAPTIPRISSPIDKSEVTTQQVDLEVFNASDIDLDTLTYEFELYSDENMNLLKGLKTGILEEGDGTTSWRIDTPLDDNTLYWWRAQCRDDENKSSSWTSLFQFFINTLNDSPSSPSIKNPQNGEELSADIPKLEIINSKDPDRDLLTYFFEIDKSNTFNTSSLETSPEIPEGEDTTSWIPAKLDDNTTYYWRAIAYDGAAYSEHWTVGSFFVNLFNDPPSVPTINNPVDNAEVTILKPILIVNPSLDVDFDQLNYNFEVYQDSNLIASITGADSSWKVNVSLKDNARHFWRVQAVDEHGANSNWSDPVSFLVNIKNDKPTTPTLNSPVDGGIITSLTITLSVNNAPDPDDDMLEYEFDLYSDKDLSNKLAYSIESQGNLITSWKVPMKLADNTVYYWRARAYDGKLASSWMPTAIFMVNTSGTNTMMKIEASKKISASSQTIQTIKVIDNDSPIKGVCLDIPPGALQNDCTITIGIIINPPALPPHIKTIGRIIEFGPSGTTFSSPVSIMIPFNHSDLKNANIDSLSELKIFTYDTLTLSWEQIPVDSVDELNALLNCKVDHFSMYTIGIIPETDTSTHSQNVLSFQGTGCFINTTF